MKSINNLIILAFLPIALSAQALYIENGATVHVERGSGTATVLYVDGDLETLGTLDANGRIEVNAAADLPGNFHFMIGGTTSGIGYDPLFAGSIITPTGGTLDVTLTGGFTPSLGDEFTVLDGGSLSGTFSNINLPALASPNYWGVAYAPATGLLKLTVSSILPIELLDFQAFAEGNMVRLNWRTASEVNADRFEVEHSTDGSSFVKIGTVKAAGGAAIEQYYSLLHERPVVDANYYRLRSVDMDGSFEFSQVVSVDFRNLEDFRNLVQAFPNPIGGGELTLVLDENAGDEYEAQLLDASGRLLRTAILFKGINSLDVSDLVSGVYQLQLGSFCKKIVVTR